MQVTSRAAAARVRGRRVGLVVALVVVLAILTGAAWLVARPSVTATSRAQGGDVTIECAGVTGVSESACREWGDAILADDPAPRTFEREDLRRVTIDRSAWGFGDACSVAFFISRYPDRPAWSGEVPCR